MGSHTGPILSLVRAARAVHGLRRELKQDQALQKVLLPHEGMSQLRLCCGIAASGKRCLETLLKGSAGTRGFNCTLGILFSSRPGIIYKNRKEEKRGERKNIKGLLNFHAACEQAAFRIRSQPLGGCRARAQGAQPHRHRANGGSKGQILEQPRRLSQTYCTLQSS